MIRAVFDANVYVSALQFGGSLAGLMTDVNRGSFYLIVSSEIRNEVNDVLGRFGWSRERAVTVETHVKCRVCRDVRDDHLFATCVVSKAEFLVSGDKDVLAIGRYGVTQVVTPAHFTRILHEQR